MRCVVRINVDVNRTVIQHSCSVHKLNVLYFRGIPGYDAIFFLHKITLDLGVRTALGLLV